jgi:hypothetical protein
MCSRVLPHPLVPLPLSEGLPLCLVAWANGSTQRLYPTALPNGSMIYSAIRARFTPELIPRSFLNES